jgi:hypothetical protein
MTMSQSDQQDLERELRSIFQEKNPDGTQRWTQAQVEDCCALIMISSVEGQIENLDATSQTLVLRFLARAQLDNATGEVFQNRAKAYFEANPVAEDLTLRLAQCFRGRIVEQNSLPVDSVKPKLPPSETTVPGAFARWHAQKATGKEGT